MSGTEVATAAVSLVPSARGFGQRLASQIGPDVDRAGRSNGKRLGAGMAAGLAGMGGKVFAPLAAAAAAIGVKNFLADAIGEARESQKVGALTASIIRSTGGAAKVTADQVGNLATAISNKTGVDDEAIQSGSNLLLTFKNVRNEAGKGSDIFNRATAAAVDLSKAGFGSIEGSSKMLGKALNDPVKGISALSRAGVTFTQEQKDQIGTLVKSGKTLDAQKIILRELESQVGGAAAATATNGEKMAVAFGNFKEQIGTALLPVIDKVAGFLTSKVIPAVSGFFTEMQTGTGAGGAVVAFFRNIWTTLQPLGGLVTGIIIPAVKGLFSSFTSSGGPAVVAGVFATIRTTIASLVPVIVSFVTGTLIPMFSQGVAIIRSLIPPVIAFVTGTLVPLFQQAVTFIQTQVVPGFLGIVNAVRGFVAVALPIVQQFVAGISARIGPLLPQFRSIFTTIASIVTGTMGLIQAIIQRATAVISFVWAHFGSYLMDYVRNSFAFVMAIVRTALGVVQGIIKTVTSVIRGDWSGAWEGIKAIFRSVMTGITDLASATMAHLRTFIDAGIAAVKVVWSAGMTLLKTVASTALNGVITFFQQLPGRILSALGNLGSLLLNVGSDIVSGLINGIVGAGGRLMSAVTGFIRDHIPGPIKSLLGIASPSKVMIQFGKWITEGLAIGITGSAKQVGAASKGLAGQVTRVFQQRRNTASAALIASLRAEISRLIPLAKKHKAAAAQLARARANLSAAVAGKALSSDAAYAAATRFVDGLRGQTSKLANIAKARETVAARLKSAQKKLTDSTKVRDDYASSVRQSFESLSNVAQTGAFTSFGIIAKLRQNLTAAKSFSSNLAKLTKLGLSKTAYKQLVDAGVEQGGLAAALLAQGGSRDVKTVNSLVAQITGTGGAVAKQASSALYQAGVDSAKGLIRGLQSQGSALAAAAKKVAATLVGTVKKALGIKSPSRVFASQVGRHIPTGIAAGIESEKAGLRRSIDALTYVPRIAAGLGDISGAPSQRGPLVHVENLHTNDPDAAAKALETRFGDAVSLANMTVRV